MCGGSMQMHDNNTFKSKDDIQFIIGTNFRKICRDKNINLMEFAE